MTATVYDIGDKKLTIREIQLMTLISQSPDQQYCSPENEEAWVREALDALVLSGILLRARSATGQWLKEWYLVPAADAWVDSADVYTDVARAHGRHAKSLDILLTTFLLLFSSNGGIL